MTSASGNSHLFKVQVRVDRLSLHKPLTLSDGIVTTEWRDYHPDRVPKPNGIPQLGRFDFFPVSERWLDPCGAFESALAMAHCLIANHEARDILSSVSNLQCRLVRVNVKYSFSIDDEGPIDYPVIEKKRWGGEMKLISDMKQVTDDI